MTTWVYGLAVDGKCCDDWLAASTVRGLNLVTFNSGHFGATSKYSNESAIY